MDSGDNPLRHHRPAVAGTKRARLGKTLRVLLWTASVALLAFSWIAILSPTLSSETAAPTWTHSITFPNAGKFLISLPNEITAPIITTAAQLLEALEDTVGCDYVARHQTWDDTFLVYDNAGNCSRCDYDLTNCINEPGGSGCFCIDPAEGRGFFVDVGAGTFSMTASDVTYYYMELEAPGAASLTGTNFVSLPYDLFPTTAKLLMRELDPTNVQQIERFLTTTETFQVYSFGLPDFPIGCGEGYVVKMTTTLAYVPFHTGAEPPECPVGGPAPCEQGPFPTCDGSCPFAYGPFAGSADLKGVSRPRSVQELDRSSFLTILRRRSLIR